MDQGSIPCGETNACPLLHDILPAPTRSAHEPCLLRVPPGRRIEAHDAEQSQTASLTHRPALAQWLRPGYNSLDPCRLCQISRNISSGTRLPAVCSQGENLASLPALALASVRSVLDCVQRLPAPRPPAHSHSVAHSLSRHAHRSAKLYSYSAAFIEPSVADACGSDSALATGSTRGENRRSVRPRSGLAAAANGRCHRLQRC